MIVVVFGCYSCFQYLTKITKPLLLCIITLLCPLKAFAESENILHLKALQLVKISDLKQIDPNLTGSDVNVAVICRSLTYTDGQPQNDYRPNIEHNCFADNNFKFNEEIGLPAGTSPHSTAVCSILFGQDPNAFDPQIGQFAYEGIVPAANAEIYEFWHFLINNIFPQISPDADVLTASIGNPTEDWWTRGIGSIAQTTGLTVVASIGNGTDVHEKPLYPGAGANVIGVGVVDSVNSDDLATSLENFALAYPEHSSFGPTDDRRCKPDIVAPGNLLAADINDPNHYEPTGSWSSFSTPVVTGAVSLLIQKAKHDPNLSLAVSTQGGNCVIKSILMSSATKLPFWHKGQLTKEDDQETPLDRIQGAGMLNALAAYDLLTAGRHSPNANDVPTTGWDLNRLQKENTYRFTIPSPANKFITATAVWNQHYQDTYPFDPIPEKDADFKLQLWAIDTNDANNSYLADSSDSRYDNVEHIYFHPDPNYDTYEITISYSDNQSTADNQYALSWNISDKQDTSSNILWYDLNADGIVDELDLTILIDNLLNSRQTLQNYPLGDINNDSQIDIKDLQILSTHKNMTADWHKPN